MVTVLPEGVAVTGDPVAFRALAIFVASVDTAVAA